MPKVISAVLETRLELYSKTQYRTNIRVTLDDNEENNFVFEERNGIYRGESGDVVRFYAYHLPGNGFGGSRINVKMSDGTTRELIGPWSSRAGCIHAEYPDREPVVECTNVKWNMVTHVKLSRLKELGIEFEPEFAFGELYYRPIVERLAA